MENNPVNPRLGILTSFLPADAGEAFTAIFNHHVGDWNEIADSLSEHTLLKIRQLWQGMPQIGANKSSIVTSESTKPMLCSFLYTPKGVTVVRNTCLEVFERFLKSETRLRSSVASDLESIQGSL